MITKRRSFADQKVSTFNISIIWLQNHWANPHDSKWWFPYLSQIRPTIAAPKLLVPYIHYPKNNHLIFEMFRETPWFCVVFNWFSIYQTVPARYLPPPPGIATSPVLQRALHERILRPQWRRKLHPNLATKLQRADGLPTLPCFWLVGFQAKLLGGKKTYHNVYLCMYVYIYIMHLDMYKQKR